MIQVTVAYARYEWQQIFQLSLPAGARVADALAAVSKEPALIQVPMATASVGIWGTLCGRDRLLVDGDRVEIYRPLMADAKEHRRARAMRQREADASES